MKTILIIEDDRRITHNISRNLTDEGYQTELVRALGARYGPATAR